jgi:hypothetical protein
MKDGTMKTTTTVNALEACERISNDIALSSAQRPLLRVTGPSMGTHGRSDMSVTIYWASGAGARAVLVADVSTEHGIRREFLSMDATTYIVREAVSLARTFDDGTDAHTFYAQLIHSMLS